MNQSMSISTDKPSLQINKLFPQFPNVMNKFHVLDYDCTNLDGTDLKNAAQEIQRVHNELKLDPSIADGITYTFPPRTMSHIIAQIVPQDKATYQSDATDQRTGNKIYRYWLNKQKACTFPSGATTNLGVRGSIYDREADQILLIAHAKTNKDGKVEYRIENPGGDVDGGEELLEALIRELGEETGLTEDQLSAVLNQAKLASLLLWKNHPLAPSIMPIFAASIPNIAENYKHKISSEVPFSAFVDIETIINHDKKTPFTLGEEVVNEERTEYKGKLGKGVQETARSIRENRLIPCAEDTGDILMFGISPKTIREEKKSDKK